MINVSGDFLQKLYNDERDYLEKIDMNLLDGTTLHLTNKDIWSGSLVFDDAVGSDNSFTALGSAIINSVSFTINNIYDEYSQYDFMGAVAHIYIGLDIDGTPEYIKKGIFTVNETTYNGQVISLKLYDNMYKFDMPYSNSGLQYPASLDTIVRNACETCGVYLSSSSLNFPRKNFVIQNVPKEESTTFREVISWCATIAGCFARCNANGYLELKWFDISQFDTVDDIDGGVFDGDTGNYVKSFMQIGDEFQSNGLTVKYVSDGWWHVYGTRENNSAIRFDLYEDVLDKTSGSYTFRLETKGFIRSQEPDIGYLCYPQQGQLVSWNSHSSPYTTNVYSLPILGLAFLERTGSALPAYDGFVRISVTSSLQKPYLTGDTADGGTLSPWSVGDSVDGGQFDFADIHIISSLYSQNVSVDDVVITQILAEVRVENDDVGSAIHKYTSGVEGYGISIKGNDFITESNAQDIVNYLGTQIIGTRFRKANVQHGSNPSIEAGDCAYIFDRKGNRYSILVTRTCFKVGASQTTICGADTPMRNSASRFSESTKSYVELRQRLVDQRDEFTRKQEEIAERIENAQGLYFTEVEQQTGGSKYYLHDKEDLDESDIQILVSDVGITVTPDGGDTWYGLTVDGQLIAAILTVIGINADWINTGQIVVKRGQTEVFFVDVDTGQVRIKADSFSLTSGDTIESIADDAASTAVTTSNAYTDNKFSAANQALSDFAQQVTDDIADLQNQIDGQIETWYYDYVPTLNNLPASDWTTEDLKEGHQGDVFVDTSTGRSYRFLKNNNVWQWKIIEDTDTALALQTATDALDLADHKRRVFVSQPEPPYDVGDLWVQGSNGDILRCQTGKSSNASYSSEDWVLASKYTDDSALQTFLDGDYASDINSIQGQIDQKIETWYQNTDPSYTWSETAKIEHTGDIWYCTANTGTYAQKTWQYDGSSWQEMKTMPPSEVIDTIDGKAQIFISTPETPYAVGDLWFDSSTSDIMTCVTARASGNFTASDWQKRNKYTDDTAINNLAIGGRNLLLSAGTQTTSENYLNRRFDLSPVGQELKANDDVTFSFKARVASDRLRWGLYNSGGTVPITGWQAIEPDGNSDVVYKWSGKWSVVKGSTTASNTFVYLYLGTSSTQESENIIYWAKLERGNKATDFTAAPEDIETELSSLGDSLKSQIDGKIQTWVQSSNPASSWTASQRESHNGDLWYYTGETTETYTNNTTYKYNANTNTWVSYAVSPDLFDVIDGKVNIFYGDPNTDYEGQKVGDYLVDPTDGSSYRRTNNSWVEVTNYSSAITTQLDNWIHGEFQDTIDQVRGQLDEKSETWYQQTDPSSDWTTSELKTEHKGDMWFCTSTTGNYAQKYWVWSGTTWQEMKTTPPQSVFDQIDGKAQIFIAQPRPPYHVGDLWFNSSTSDIMTCVTTRTSGSYTATDWQKRNKYTDDTTVKAQYGTCSTAADVVAKEVTLSNFTLYSGARISVYFTYANTATAPTLNVNNTGAKVIYAYGSALAANSPYNWAAKSTIEFVYNGTRWVMADSGANAKIKTLDQSLTQQNVFNRLTNNGTAQGIFIEGGQLYINMSYLQTGILKLGGTNNISGTLEVYDGSTPPVKIGKWDKDGAEISGKITLLGDLMNCHIGKKRQPVFNWGNTTFPIGNYETFRYEALNSNGNLMASRCWAKMGTSNDFSDLLLLPHPLNARSAYRAHRVVAFCNGKENLDSFASSDASNIVSLRETVAVNEDGTSLSYGLVGNGFILSMHRLYLEISSTYSPTINKLVADAEKNLLDFQSGTSIAKIWNATTATSSIIQFKNGVGQRIELNNNANRTVFIGHDNGSGTTTTNHTYLKLNGGGIDINACIPTNTNSQSHIKLSNSGQIEIISGTNTSTSGAKISASYTSIWIGSTSTGNGNVLRNSGSTLYWGSKIVQMQSSSSKRYKHNIELLHDDVLNPHRLYDLRVKQFRYNADVALQYPDIYGMIIPGFIAEDVAEIYPSAVIHHPEHSDDIESWDERRIIPPMLALIQEQHQQINELTSRIEQLESIIRGV